MADAGPDGGHPGGRVWAGRGQRVQVLERGEHFGGRARRAQDAPEKWVGGHSCLARGNGHIPEAPRSRSRPGYYHHRPPKATLQQPAAATDADAVAAASTAAAEVPDAAAAAYSSPTAELEQGCVWDERQLWGSVLFGSLYMRLPSQRRARYASHAPSCSMGLPYAGRAAAQPSPIAFRGGSVWRRAYRGPRGATVSRC